MSSSTSESERERYAYRYTDGTDTTYPGGLSGYPYGNHPGSPYSALYEQQGQYHHNPYASTSNFGSIDLASVDNLEISQTEASSTGSPWDYSTGITSTTYSTSLSL
jgi:hypothetical protein